MQSLSTGSLHTWSANLSISDQWSANMHVSTPQHTGYRHGCYTKHIVHATCKTGQMCQCKHEMNSLHGFVSWCVTHIRIFTKVAFKTEPGNEMAPQATHSPFSECLGITKHNHAHKDKSWELGRLPQTLPCPDLQLCMARTGMRPVC